MNKSIYQVTRDLHLYLGLFISPFVLVFAISVIFLVHSWDPGLKANVDRPKLTASDLQLPLNLAELSGRELVDVVRPTLEQIGVTGEVEFIQHVPKEHRMLVPVTVPGRQTLVSIDLLNRTAEITRRTTGIWDA
jgi:hypothetical protein